MRIRPTTPTYALQLMYKKKLMQLIDEMQNSVTYWIGATYKKRLPEIIQDAKKSFLLRCYRYITDASPSRELEKQLKSIMKRWNKRFSDRSEEIAQEFIKRVNTAASSSLFQAFKKAGIAFTLKNTLLTNNVIQALILENVNLIKSIPQKYFTEVQGLIMRSIRDGRDMGYLTEELTKRYDIVRNRAITISRDQTNKATESITRERNKALGIKQGIWMHRGGSKHPRQSHIEMDGTIFNLSEGCYDASIGRKIFPGELVNCNCTYSPVLPTFGEGNEH